MKPIIVNGHIRRLLTSPKEILNKKDKIMKKDPSAFHKKAEGIEEYMSYDVVLLKVTPKVSAKKELSWECTSSFIKRQVNREAPYVAPFIEKNILFGGYRHSAFSRAFLVLEVEECEGNASEELKKEAVEHVIGMLQNSRRIWAAGEAFWIDSVNEEGKFRYLTEKACSAPEQVYVYGRNDWEAAIATAGQNKKWQITLPCNNLPGFNFKKILNELTFGMVNRLEAAGRTTDAVKPMAQLSTREGQCEAPQVEGLYLRTAAFLMGIYDSRWDGSCYLSSSFAAKWLQDRLGSKYVVDESAARGMTMQARPFMVKGNSSVIPQDYLADILNRRGYEIVLIGRKEATEEEQKAFDQVVWSKGKEGPLAGKLVVLVPSIAKLSLFGIEASKSERGFWTTDNPAVLAYIDFFTDLNGLKETFEVNRRSGLNVLSFCEENDGMVTASTQTIATYAVANWSKTKDLVKELAHEQMFKKARLFHNGSEEVSNRDLADNPNYDDILKKVSPEFLRKYWFPGYKRACDQALKGLSKNFGNLNIDCKGVYCVFVVDAGLDYGLDLLKIDGDKAEVFCKDLDVAEEGMMVRYPKANAFGFSIIKAVGINTMLVRASKQLVDKGIGEDDRQMILDTLRGRLKAQAEGVVMLPASEDFMAKHDGHDFDGDHGQIVTDERVLSIVKNALNVTVHICDDAEYQAAEKEIAAEEELK